MHGTQSPVHLVFTGKTIDVTAKLIKKDDDEGYYYFFEGQASRVLFR